jgi:uncharacterized Zn-binding protein involved in type VI secretion
MTNRKFELVADQSIEWMGRKLFRIRALIVIERFGVKPGDAGGYVEKAENVSEDGDAWVSGDALVCGNARVSGDALVCGNAQVCGDAWVSGDALVCGNARVSGNALVCGNAQVYGNAWVSGDAWVYGNARVSSGLIAMATRSDGYGFAIYQTDGGGYAIAAGCRLFTSFDAAREHWERRKGTQLGDETDAILLYLESSAKARGYIAKVSS